MTALFPAGSITGSPKPATMRIIRELERSPRGVYCGALGSVAPPDEGGGLEFSVGIRTVVIDGQEGVAEYGVGGAITWDSVPQSEYEEARLKAQLLVERRPDFDLVETIRWSPDTGFVLLEEHLTRLERSAGYFGFAWDPDLVVECVDKEVTGHEAARQVRVVVGRCGTVTASSAAITEPFVADPVAAPTITVTVAEDPVSSGDVFLFHATTHRDAYEARRDRHPGVDDVLLVNERGELTETTVGNLALRFGDRWWTPSVESGCLSGAYRQRLLDQGRLRERAIAVHELYAADEIAVVDGIRGWRRAVLAE
jgi:para-aminobenzoate synthetase/4-amino-4-deoxychorismate lyase